jgi:hypothetical protein
MDLTEAVHTQTLIDWLTNPHAVTDAQAGAARDAAAWLADRAHQVSPAGPTAAQVQRGWDNLLAGCSGCGDCTPDPDDLEEVDRGDVDGRPPAGGLSDDDVHQLVADGWLAPVPAGDARAEVSS